MIQCVNLATYLRSTNEIILDLFLRMVERLFDHTYHLELEMFRFWTSASEHCVKQRICMHAIIDLTSEWREGVQHVVWASDCSSLLASSKYTSILWRWRRKGNGWVCRVRLMCYFDSWLQFLQHFVSAAGTFQHLVQNQIVRFLLQRQAEVQSQYCWL